MYRNEGTIRDKSYQSHNHDLNTLETAIQDYQSLETRIDERIHSLSTQQGASQNTANIETINRLKNSRLQVRAGLATLQEMNEEEWETKREEYNATFAKANQSVVEL